LLSVVALFFFIVNVTNAFTKKNNLYKSKAFSIVPAAFVVNFPEAATDFTLLVQNLHFDVMAVIIFVVCFVTYLLIRIIYLFQQTLE
jgi:hypothetical protein